MSLTVGFQDGSAVRITSDTVLLEAPGRSEARAARRFSRAFASVEGWRSIDDPGWPLRESEAPGMALAAAARALRPLFGDRLRRARLVVIPDKPDHRREALLLVRRLYGEKGWRSGGQADDRSTEVILLITPACDGGIAADPASFLLRAHAFSRRHTDAVVLHLSEAEHLPSLRPLTTLIRELEAGTKTEHEATPSAGSDDGETAGNEVDAASADDDSAYPALQPF